MSAYRSIKRRIAQEFPTDEILKSRIAEAESLDQILVALGVSYRDAVREPAVTVAGDATAQFSVEGAERAAAAREAVLLELLHFFERDRVATRDVEVRRTGPQALRVVCRQTPQSADPTTAR